MTWTIQRAIFIGEFFCSRFMLVCVLAISTAHDVKTTTVGKHTLDGLGVNGYLGNVPNKPVKLDPRIRRTRQMLFQAFQALLAEKSFDLITVQDITERSTLNRATFYDHFTDKFALLGAMMGERFSTHIGARMAGSDSTCESSLKQLVLAACDFLSEVSSGCQKKQAQFEPLVESQVKEIIRQSLLKGLRSHKAKNPELKATMVAWAITGAAMQWSREKKTSADDLAKAILPTIHMALAAGE
jgi:AcrR family transcriptional regulator